VRPRMCSECVVARSRGVDRTEVVSSRQGVQARPATDYRPPPPGPTVGQPRP
jgi:hypothetical protein